MLLLLKKSKWDLMKDIRNEIATKCLGKVEFFEHLDDPEYVSFWESLPALAEYIVQIIENASNENGFEGLWSEYQPQFQQQIEKLNSCSDKDSKFLTVLYVHGLQSVSYD